MLNQTQAKQAFNSNRELFTFDAIQGLTSYCAKDLTSNDHFKNDPKVVGNATPSDYELDRYIDAAIENWGDYPQKWKSGFCSLVESVLKGSSANDKPQDEPIKPLEIKSRPDTKKVVSLFAESDKALEDEDEDEGCTEEVSCSIPETLITAGFTPYATKSGVSLNDKSSDEILTDAGLDFTFLEAPVQCEGLGADEILTFDSHKVIYRSDTKEKTGIVGRGFKTVQPQDLIGFYKELSARAGWELDSVGQVRHGAIIHASARTPLGFSLGDDEVKGFYFLASGADGTCATTGKLSSLRTTCNNMLHVMIQDQGIHDISMKIRHTKEVDWEALINQIQNLPKEWEKFEEAANLLASKEIGDKQAYEFFYNLYMREKKNYKDNRAKVLGKQADKMMDIYKDHPTQQTSAAKGSAWGLVNAVTYFEDHVRKTATENSRFCSAMIAGNGVTNKEDAFKAAMTLAA